MWALLSPIHRNRLHERRQCDPVRLASLYDRLGDRQKRKRQDADHVRTLRFPRARRGRQVANSSDSSMRFHRTVRARAEARRPCRGCARPSPPLPSPELAFRRIRDGANYMGGDAGIRDHLRRQEDQLGRAATRGPRGSPHRAARSRPRAAEPRPGDHRTEAATQSDRCGERVGNEGIPLKSKRPRETPEPVADREQPPVRLHINGMPGLPAHAFCTPSPSDGLACHILSFLFLAPRQFFLAVKSQPQDRVSSDLRRKGSIAGLARLLDLALE